MRFGTTRRDFLKLIGGAVGCSLLSSCGGSGGGTSGPAPGPLPNGYVFTRVYTPGDAILPSVRFLTPEIMLDERGHAFFYAQDAQDRYGLYELTLDFAGSLPRAVGARALIKAGQKLPDGRVVSSVGSVDVNRAGDTAMVLNYDAELSPKELGPTSIALDQKGELELIFDFGGEAPEGGQYGEFGDLDLHDDHLLFVSRYGGGGVSTQGLVYAPAESGNAGLVVFSAEDEIPSADGSINALGLVDLDDGGEFVLQAFGLSPQTLPRSDQPGSSPGSFIMQGNVHQPGQARLLTASRELVLARTENPPSLGTSLHGPRIGGPGITTAITEEGMGNLTLYRDEVPIARTGELSPGGSPIRIIVPAVVNASGLTFYEVATDQGIELCMHNGQTSALLLSRGALVDGVAVDTIAFGFHTTMADAAGRIISYVQMANGQESILVGVPV